MLLNVNIMSSSVFSRIRIIIHPIAFRCKHKSTMKKETISAKLFHLVFKKYLLWTNSITSGLFLGLGDCMQQAIEEQYFYEGDRYDWDRTARMSLVGAMMGPLHHLYYIQLDKLIPKSNFYTAIKKIFLDQTIASPLTLLFFFIAMGVLENKDVTEISSEIQKKLMVVYLGDCLYWPPIQFINFYYLPTRYRVLYINAATMVFNVFLSYMKHFYGHEHHGEGKKKH